MSTNNIFCNSQLEDIWLRAVTKKFDDLATFGKILKLLKKDYDIKWTI